MHVLIAEDDPTSQCILTKMMAKWGFEVTLAKNGTEAWEICQQKDSPRFVLLDVVMPDIDGLEICRRMRSIEGDQPFYIILVTSLGQRDNVVEGFRAGADDYVTKPFDHKILRWRMDAGIRLMQMRETLADRNKKLEAYANEMEQLAEDRAQQLIHSDRLATVGTLSAGIAHEITNPAAYIAMNVRHLEQYWQTTCEHMGFSCAERLGSIMDETPQIYESLHKGVKRIQRIVDSLRLYSRRHTEQETNVNVNTCVQEALVLCENRLKAAVEVTTDFASDLPNLTANSQELEQVIINLVINSIDAMESTTNPKLNVSTYQEDTWVNIVIEDNGPGIPDSVVREIFKPFYTTKDPGKGTGMGLAICQSLIENHHGFITAGNHDGGGACFVITLPIQSEEEEASELIATTEQE